MDISPTQQYLEPLSNRITFGYHQPGLCVILRYRINPLETATCAYPLSIGNIKKIVPTIAEKRRTEDHSEFARPILERGHVIEDTFRLTLYALQALTAQIIAQQ